MKSRKVVIVPYDPDWPRQFERERRVLESVFAGNKIAIEHVGSTAVRDLGGKPIVDVMAGLSDLDAVERRIEALDSVGYEYVNEYESQFPARRYFRKPRVGPRQFHLHCVIKESEFWIRQLAFRDYLRAHPATAAAYYDLKRDLAIRVTKEEFTDAKSAFIENILLLCARTRDIHQHGGSHPWPA